MGRARGRISSTNCTVQLTCSMALQVTVLDGNNQPVRQGTIGEVCLRGPNVTRGYLNRPEANKEVCVARYPRGCLDAALVPARCILLLLASSAGASAPCDWHAHAYGYLHGLLPSQMMLRLHMRLRSATCVLILACLRTVHWGSQSFLNRISGFVKTRAPTEDQ